MGSPGLALRLPPSWRLRSGPTSRAYARIHARSSSLSLSARSVQVQVSFYRAMHKRSRSG